MTSGALPVRVVLSNGPGASSRVVVVLGEVGNNRGRYGCGPHHEEQTR